MDAVGADGCEAAAALTPLARFMAKGTEGEIQHVRALLGRGVRATPEALQWAARQSRPEMVGLLLDRAEEAGWLYLKETYARPPYAEQVLPSPSPYHQRWFAPLLGLLLEHGADLSLRDHEGRFAADHVPADDHDRVFKRRLLRAFPETPASR